MTTFQVLIRSMVSYDITRISLKIRIYVVTYSENNF